MSPASSGPALICLRSLARIAPSLIGSSYCLPVRLSVMVSVSAIEVAGLVVTGAFLSVVTLLLVAMVQILVVGRRYRLAWRAIAAVRPSRQVFVTASFAAEGTPPLIHGTRAAQDAQCGVAHPVNSVITTKLTKIAKHTNPYHRKKIFVT